MRPTGSSMCLLWIYYLEVSLWNFKYLHIDFIGRGFVCLYLTLGLEICPKSIIHSLNSSLSVLKLFNVSSLGLYGFHYDSACIKLTLPITSELLLTCLVNHWHTFWFTPIQDRSIQHNTNVFQHNIWCTLKKSHV